jgi:hypothetical protein
MYFPEACIPQLHENHWNKRKLIDILEAQWTRNGGTLLHPNIYAGKIFIKLRIDPFYGDVA